MNILSGIPGWGMIIAVLALILCFTTYVFYKDIVSNKTFFKAGENPFTLLKKVSFMIINIMPIVWLIEFFGNSEIIPENQTLTSYYMPLGVFLIIFSSFGYMGYELYRKRRMLIKSEIA